MNLHRINFFDVEIEESGPTDDISCTAVPAPAAFLLFACALAAINFSHRDNPAEACRGFSLHAMRFIA